MSAVEIDSIIEEYERSFRSDSNTDIFQFVPPRSSEHYDEILTELIRVEMELNWHTKRRKTLAEYSRLFPSVVQNPECLDRIAFEEYRLRVASGESVTPQDYQTQHGIKAYHWPLLSALSESEMRVVESSEDVGRSGEDDSGDSSLPGLAKLDGRMLGGRLPNPPTVESTLQRRLRFVSLTFTLSLLYLAVLAWLNPVTKVGLFLGSPWLLWLNSGCLTICLLICAFLWSRSDVKLANLRILELILFGSVLAELACGLASDLFADFELAVPIYEGEHELFQYASSWSLPFFAMIVAYGTLIPSSWRRCTIVVCIIGMVPIVISTAAVISLHSFSTSFFQSFLLQMIIWMATAAGIAIYGVRRLEETQYQMLRSGKLGKYRLIRQISAGGMGVVYEAEHTLLNRRCAIKLILPKWSIDPRLLARFEREVQALASISHPNVVQIHDYGFTNDSAFYFVMEFLEGQNLEQAVAKNGPLPPRDAVRILTQVADALATIHRNKIVHRDLKPSNIFLADNPRPASVKILDFGLIKSISDLESEQQVTQDGAIIGTPAYMSPEQAAGGQVDHRTDLYSFGAVAYFMLTGKLLFDRPTAVETLTAHINSQPSPLLNTDSPAQSQLQEILYKCLAKDPDLRFKTATELSLALTQVEFSPTMV